MTEHNFKLQQDTRSVSSLKIHLMVESMGYLRPDDLYIADLTYLGVYKEPIVTEEGYVLTLPDYVEAARKAGITDIGVLVITGATMNNLMRLINFESRPWYRASKSILYKSIKVLQHHLWNTEEGKQWRETIKGDNINEKVGYLVGYGPSTVSLVKSIGDADYSLLDMIDDPESDMTLTRAQQLIKDNALLEAKKDKLEYVNHSNIPDDDSDDDEGDSDDDDQEEGEGSEGSDTDGSGSVKGTNTTTAPQPGNTKTGSKSTMNRKPAKVKVKCDIPLTSFSIGLGRYGDFALDLQTGRPAMLYNDTFLGHVSISDKDTNNPTEGLHYVVQSVDLNWSFQVIATRITNIVKEEEVFGKQA